MQVTILEIMKYLGLLILFFLGAAACSGSNSSAEEISGDSEAEQAGESSEENSSEQQDNGISTYNPEISEGSPQELLGDVALNDELLGVTAATVDDIEQQVLAAYRLNGSELELKTVEAPRFVVEDTVEVTWEITGFIDHASSGERIVAQLSAVDEGVTIRDALVQPICDSEPTEEGICSPFEE